MFLLNAQLGQIAVNTANEGGLMVVGIVACFATFALLLWKRDNHSHQAQFKLLQKLLNHLFSGGDFFIYA